MDKKLLVTYASKSEETADIAQRIGNDLLIKGLDVDVLPVTEVTDISSYDGVVIGSCVYIGQWNDDATMFVKRFEDDLKFVPVWIFSNGNTGEADVYKLVRGWRLPGIVQKYVDRIEPQGVTVFLGATDDRELNWAEKLMMGYIDSNFGDHQNWKKVDFWASQIATQFA